MMSPSMYCTSFSLFERCRSPFSFNRDLPQKWLCLSATLAWLTVNSGRLIARFIVFDGSGLMSKRMSSPSFFIELLNGDGDAGVFLA